VSDVYIDHVHVLAASKLYSSPSMQVTCDGDPSTTVCDSDAFFAGCNDLGLVAAGSHWPSIYTADYRSMRHDAPQMAGGDMLAQPGRLWA
jgi:hypothetical protein